MSNDEQQIRNLIETWLRATHEGDLQTILSLMTPDVIFMVPGQKPMQGRDAFADAMRSVIGKHEIQSESTIEEIAVFGDVAYCRTRLNVTVTSLHSGTPMALAGHTLSILRRGEDGKWRLSRDANMVTPAM